MKLLLCRTIILYLCVLFAMRLMGKRQLGELQPEELVSTILISNLASISIESEDVPITASLIPLFLIFNCKSARVAASCSGRSAADSVPFVSITA